MAAPPHAPATGAAVAGLFLSRTGVEDRPAADVDRQGGGRGRESFGRELPAFVALLRRTDYGEDRDTGGRGSRTSVRPYAIETQRRIHRFGLCGVGAFLLPAALDEGLKERSLAIRGFADMVVVNGIDVTEQGCVLSAALQNVTLQPPTTTVLAVWQGSRLPQPRESGARPRASIGR